MTKLTLLYNITPNKAGNLFYMPYQSNMQVFDDRYIKALTEESLKTGRAPYEVEAGTYKIYDGYIDLSFDDTGKFYHPELVTYTIIENDNKYWRTEYYHVDRIKLIPSGIRLFISLDNWATYIDRAELLNPRITRSNLNLGIKPDPAGATVSNRLSQKVTYTTDELKPVTVNRPTYYPVDNSFFTSTPVTRNELVFVAAIQYQANKNLTEESEQVDLFVIERFTEGVTDNLPDVLYLYQKIQGIYKLTKMPTDRVGAPKQVDLKAVIKKLYLMPRGLIENALGVADWQFETATQGTGPGTIKDLLNAQIISNDFDQEFNILLNFGDPLYNNLSDIPQLGCEMFVGTKFDSVKIPCHVGLGEVRVKCVWSNDNFQIVLSSEIEEKEITSAFELPFVANTGSLTAQETTAKAISTLTQFIAGAAQIATGNPLGMITGGLTIAGAAQGLTQWTGRGSYFAGGNGLATFRDIITGESEAWCYVICKGATVMQDESRANIRENGAYCNYISPKFNKSNTLNILINNSIYLIKDTEYPVIAGVCDVQEIPSEAADYIFNMIQQGIKIRIVQF